MPFQAERSRAKLAELEREVDRLTVELSASDAKRKEAENHLMTEESIWKSERTALEEKLKKVRDFLTIIHSVQYSSKSATCFRS
jgi:predicted  nucleic acid-binding Zn-ribbon protein